MTALYHAHSGVRYLVLLMALVVIVLAAHGLASRRAATRADRITMSVFTGVLDLQVLLGLGLIVAGIFYGALMGHLMMMILAVVAAHAAGAMARKSSDHRRAHLLRLAGAGLALLLIIGGVMAIGRSPLESNVRTSTQ